MERSFAAEVKQLALGEGQVLRGEGVLAITKALLQSGVSYVGGYVGAPVSHLLDVLADANEPILKPLGVYLDASASEAAAGALLGASINYPMRGAVAWKSVVGTNVAADALSNLASSGVIGGALIVVGEDYGAGATIMQERTLAFALKSTMWLIDPRPNLPSFARMVEEGFALSEASNTPTILSLRIRACHLRGAMVCKDNRRPRIGMYDKLTAHSYDYGRLCHPPATYAQEIQKFERRLPAARRYIVERALNETIPGEDPELGLILPGGLTSTALRALALLGAADEFGRSRVPLLALNVVHPLVPDQLLAFLEGKRRVLVLEEGMPNFIEQEIKALAYDRALGVRIQGKETVAAHGEYTPEVVLGALARFLGGDAEARRSTLTRHVGRGREILGAPVPRRPPGFCTGCPERPVFTALKLLQRERGRMHVSSDIGCSTFSTLPPFNIGSTVLGYGMSLASGGAVGPALGQPTVAVMGDGGFWHNGFITGAVNAQWNGHDGVLVILENGYASATGQQHLPSTGTTPWGRPIRMSIERALKGLGIGWIRRIDSYDLRATLGTLRAALDRRGPGLRVVISDRECMLARQRRDRPALDAREREGRPVVRARFGVDAEICVGDHSCMNVNGCPSLTLKPATDPLKDGPTAHVDASCVACGLCGEVVRATALCPSFYEARRTVNPTPWQRFKDRIARRLLAAMGA